MKAKKGSKVKVHYTGTFEDGTTFDSSAGKEPLEFELGSGMMIKGFDSAVNGMQAGDSKKINLPPAQAYGEYNDNLLHNVPTDQVPADLNAEVGSRLAITQEDGSQVPVVVVEVNESGIVLDANHELAGKALNFEIELVSIS